jgi:hypothetical protein
LRCLLLSPLILCLLLATLLVTPPHTSDHRTRGCANRRTLSSIASYGASYGTHRRATGTSPENTSLPSLLLRRRRGCLGCLHGIKPGLFLGPRIALELVPLHLILALAFGGIDNEILSEDRPSDKG